MNLTGNLITLGPSGNGMISCHLGNYSGDIDVILDAKFYAGSMPIEQLVFFHAAVQRNPDRKTLYLDVKSFCVICSFQEDMPVNSILSIHGEFKTNLMFSNNWHGKELGVCGNFETKV